MARSFPADVKLQSFFTEQYEKENATRLKWFLDNRRGASEPTLSGPAPAKRVRGSNVPNGLPKINPLSFARTMKIEEKKTMQEIQELAREQQSSEEMFKPPHKIKENLYEGFTKEGKGRYQYLRERRETIPEKKYSFPVLSSWEYGWKIDEVSALHRPKHARTRLIQDSFYTRNRVPTLEDPTLGSALERSKTIIF